MQNQRIQKHQSDSAKLDQSARKNAKTKTPSEHISVKPIGVPEMGKAKRHEISLTPQNIHFLQRTFGNRAFGNIIQAKLKIGQPGDKYEQEADQLAEEVMSMPEPEVRQKPT